MRKYLLPTLLVLALSAGLAVAQTFSRAIQLSQDLTGAFLVDTNNGFYFPQHVLSTGPSPTASACGASPTLVGSDFAGQVTSGTGATGCTITFAKAYTTVPWCVVSGQTSPGTSPIAYSLNTTSIIVTHSIAVLKYNWVCSSAS